MTPGLLLTVGMYAENVTGQSATGKMNESRSTMARKSQNNVSPFFQGFGLDSLNKRHVRINLRNPVSCQRYKYSTGVVSPNTRR